MRNSRKIDSRHTTIQNYNINMNDCQMTIELKCYFGCAITRRLRSTTFRALAGAVSLTVLRFSS